MWLNGIANVTHRIKRTCIQVACLRANNGRPINCRQFCRIDASLAIDRETLHLFPPEAE
jgi:hypothetical protein